MKIEIDHTDRKCRRSIRPSEKSPVSLRDGISVQEEGAADELLKPIPPEILKRPSSEPLLRSDEASLINREFNDLASGTNEPVHNLSGPGSVKK